MLIYTEGKTYSPQGYTDEPERAVMVFLYSAEYPSTGHYVVEQLRWEPKMTEEEWNSDAGEEVAVTFPLRSLVALESHWKQSEVIRAAIRWMDTGEWESPK